MKRVVVVGVGALGSHVVLACRNLNVVLVVIDDDRVQQKNVLSQFHSHMVLGRNKAQALFQTMSGLFKFRIEPKPVRLTGENIDTLLEDADLVVDCVDNGETRSLIKEWTEHAGIDCLHGGLSADGMFGVAMWNDRFEVDHEPIEGQATCEDGEHLPFIQMLSSVLALRIQEYVTSGVKRNFHCYLCGAKEV